MNWFVLFSILLQCHQANPLATPAMEPPATDFLILGGSERIGTAAATHILLRKPGSNVILAGRDNARGKEAVAEVIRECMQRKAPADTASVEYVATRVSFRLLDWRDTASLKASVSECDCLIHTAGPYLNEKPLPLAVAIASERCRAYVDVSDPLDYLGESLSMSNEASKSGTTALIAAGAFPGLSNGEFALQFKFRSL